MEGSLLRTIFVYGTLRKNERNHHYLKDAVCLFEESWIYGRLFDTRNGYPVMKESEKDKIYGEVYSVTEEQLGLINELEGYSENGSNNLYERKMVTAFTDSGSNLEALTYITDRSLADSIDAIPLGDWKVYQYLKNESLYYFAYGSCMDDERFRIANAEGYFSIKAGRGVLKNHGFRFSRSSSDGGKADIIESAGEVVEGLVYKIPLEALDYLYKREGVYVNAYRPAIVQVELNKGERVEAITFIGIEKSEETPPTELYATEIIRGAKGILSESYIKRIRQRLESLS